MGKRIITRGQVILLQRLFDNKGEKMMNLNITDNYFDYVKKHPKYKVVVYGAGDMSRKNYKYMGHVDFFCDQKAECIERIDNIPCLTPEELTNFNDKVIILICIKQKSLVDDICLMLDKLRIDAEVFYFFENSAFSRFDYAQYRHVLIPKDKLRIRIVYLNDGWILRKFAYKLQGELLKLGQEADIADTESPAADVNHYIGYWQLNKLYSESHKVRTTMITHIDCTMKKDLIQFQARNGAVGICMSADTMNKLSLWGVPRDRLCYVNPAQDGEIKPKKIVLGITNRCYKGIDFRKRDDIIPKVCENLSPHYFKLKIMGAGWNEIVEKIRDMGFEVEYFEDFDREIYKELIPSLDYWIYYGFDEGAMGFLDALAAGVKTIATPQGYHLDVSSGLTYPCSTINDFIRVLKQLQYEKEDIVNAVKDWTWENYAKKHLEIWQYLTKSKPLKELYEHQSEYMDGIFSLLVSNISIL